MTDLTRTHGIVRSATAAYRADMSGRTAPFSAHDSGWIVVATLLEQATLLGETDRELFLRDAVEVSEETLGEAEIARLCAREWGDHEASAFDPIVFLADAAHYAGALNTAATMFDALLAFDYSLSDVTRGRVMAKRARVAHKMNAVEEATEYYRRVEQLGKQIDNVELRARAALGFVTIAQLKGNHPQLGRFARKAAQWADRCGLPELSRQAHTALVMVAAKAGHFDEAMQEAWLIFEFSRGTPTIEAAALAQLGQLGLEFGDLHVARAAFSIVASRPLPARILLPALGGLALATARLGEEATMEWAVQEVLSLRNSIATRFHLANALLECATALAAIGRSTEADTHRAEALRISRLHGFNEVVFNAELLDTSARATPAPHRARGAQVERVATSVFEMAPHSLPDHVAVGTVSEW